MVGILIVTFAVVAIALVFAAYGLTQAAAFLGVAAAVTTFAIAAVSLRRWATCEHGVRPPKKPRGRTWLRWPDDHSRRAA